MERPGLQAFGATEPGIQDNAGVMARPEPEDCGRPLLIILPLTQLKFGSFQFLSQYASFNVLTQSSLGLWLLAT